MEAKKTPKADLENKKILFSEIGLAVALGITLAAFEATSQDVTIQNLEVQQEEVVEEEMVPVTTQDQVKPPPPPPPKTLLTTLVTAFIIPPISLYLLPAVPQWLPSVLLSC